MPKLHPKLRLNNYELIKLIGIGGDGEVWKAYGPKGEIFALKARPVNENAHDFQREFERLRMMRIPNIIQVHEAGIANGFVYYTMDLANGTDFRTYIQRGATIKDRVKRCLSSAKPIAYAISIMHRLGLAHLDLKPDNIIVKSDGTPVLLDFGRACALGERQINSLLQGSMDYMAPEQRLGFPTTYKADSYALGVSLYEALCPVKIKDIINYQSPSLALFDKDIPVKLAVVIDSMLSLDPSERPSAESLYKTLLQLEKGISVPPLSWPSGYSYIGDANPLLQRSAMIVGPRGSGCTRMVTQARHLWFQKGYNSIAGTTVIGRSHSAIADILESIFETLTPSQRRKLAGNFATILKGLAPKLPLAAEEAALPLNPKIAVSALYRILQKLSPIAIVILEFQDSDPSTIQIVKLLSTRLPPKVKIWITSRKPFAWLNKISPPRWGPLEHQRFIKENVPKHIPITTKKVGKTPLESSLIAWQCVAAWRQELGPQPNIIDEMSSLSTLQQPFPKSVGEILCKDIDSLEKQKLVHAAKHSDQQIWYQIADQGNLLFLRQKYHQAQYHRLASQAWQRYSDLKKRSDQILYHLLKIDEKPIKQIITTIEAAVAQEDHSMAKRWLRYLDCIGIKTKAFIVEYARGWLTIHRHPVPLAKEKFTLLKQLGSTKHQKLMVQLLEFAQLSKHGSPKEVLRRGEILVEVAKAHLPCHAIEVYRLMALAKLDLDQPEAAVQICQEANLFTRKAQNSRHNFTMEQLNIKRLQLSMTHSACLAYACRYSEAVKLCASEDKLAKELGLQKEEAPILVNWSIILLRLGERQKAKKVIMKCRRIVDKYNIPSAHAWCSLVEGQLAIERGEIEAGQYKIDEAISIGQNLKSRELLAQAWTVLMDAAVHKGLPKESQRAQNGYQEFYQDPFDNAWEAALGRWYWLTGDLQKALSITKTQKKGYSGCRITAEHCRYLLISGQKELAIEKSKKLLHVANNYEMKEIKIFAQLTLQAAQQVSTSQFQTLLDQCQQSEWTELYLGSLYLDAIRRRLRGESITGCLKLLRERAAALSSKLYLALGQEELW